MIFQHVLKGIANIPRIAARQQLTGGGIVCNWWRNVDPLQESEIPDRLTEENLLRHLSAYHVVDYSLPSPYGDHPFGEYSPFISTTSGTVEVDPTSPSNITFSAFITALGFATRDFRSSGVIFYGYVNLLGRRAVKLREFAEETRDFHQWSMYQPYHHQGEIVAKINIPSPHLERAEAYDGPAALTQLDAGILPVPAWIEYNHLRYVPPEDVCNVRGYI